MKMRIRMLIQKVFQLICDIPKDTKGPFTNYVDTTRGVLWWYVLEMSTVCRFSLISVHKGIPYKFSTGGGYVVNNVQNLVNVVCKQLLMVSPRGVRHLTPRPYKAFSSNLRTISVKLFSFIFLFCPHVCSYCSLFSSIKTNSI
jgi:hypothetical protein